MQHIVQFLGSSKILAFEQKNPGSSAPPSHRGPGQHGTGVPLQDQEVGRRADT